MNILNFEAINFFVISFFLTNIIKITIFNMYITNSFETKFFIYKFIYTFSLSLIIFQILTNHPILLLIFYILEYIYLYSNLAYYNFYHYYLHLHQSITLIPEALDVLRYRVLPKNYNLLLLFIDLPFLVIIIVLYILQPSNINLLGNIGVYSIIICLVYMFIIEIYNLVNKSLIFKMIKNYPESEVQIIQKYGTFLNIIIDFFRFKNDQDRIGHFVYGDTIKSTTTGQRETNIVAIQVESMEANIINTMHNGKYIMPFLHELTENSIYYPFMLSYHKAGGTSDTEFSIINSVEPLGNFPSIKIPGYDFPNSVVKILKKNNYDALAFHGNLSSYYHREKAFDKMGFDNFYDIKKMNLNHVGWGAPDHEVFNYALDMMRVQENPYFYYIITMSSHCMFTNARHYYNNYSYDDIKDNVVRNYYNSLSYVDQSIKDFIIKIKSMDDNTAIIIWGDHTPGIKRDSFKQSLLKIKSKHLEIVPMFIITPENTMYKEEVNVASLLDIAPTLLDLAKVSYEYRTDGESLIKPNKIYKKIPYRGEEFFRSELYKRLYDN